MGALILAAGHSRRLGRPKQDVVLNGETLLHRASRVAGEADLSPVVAVVRDLAWVEGLRDLEVTVLLNERSEEGMATSVVQGVDWARRQELQGLILMTCDQPLLRPAHLRALCADPLRITASNYAGRNGVPAYFPVANFGDLLQLQGDAGARHLLREATSVTDESLALDVDTEEDLREAQRVLASQSS